MFKKTNMIKVIPVFLLMGFIALFPGSSDASASLESDKIAKEKQIQEFQKELESLKGDLGKTINAIKNVRDAINEYDKEIEGLNKEIQTIQDGITEREGEIEAKQMIFDQKKDEYITEMVTNYENGGIDYLEIVMNTEDLTEFINFNEYSRLMKLNQERRMKEIEEMKKTLEAEKKVLEEERNTMIEKRAGVELTRSKKAIENDKLLSQKDYLNDLSKQYDKKMQDEEAALQRIKDEIAKQIAYKPPAVGNGNQGPVIGTGDFVWVVPESKRITSPFGYRTSPISGKPELHKGIDIGAYQGADVVAADYGRVVYSQYNGGGFGNCIVIDHGNGLMTLYGHLYSRAVNVGDNVNQGQYIGAVGSTGWSTGPHLHFQVTNNGDIFSGVVNPMNYF